VLSGIVAAALARGLEPRYAAAAAAWLHADAGRRAGAAGLLAGDLVDALPVTLAGLWESIR
jgi:NAD(P)H-hydrate epimerase